MITPLPCPFCGTEPKLERKQLGPETTLFLFWVVCPKNGCGVAFTHGAWTETDAVTAWNVRAPKISKPRLRSEKTGVLDPAKDTVVPESTVPAEMPSRAGGQGPR